LLEIAILHTIYKLIKTIAQYSNRYQNIEIRNNLLPMKTEFPDHKLLSARDMSAKTQKQLRIKFDRLRMI